jgi:hypothetical protein
MGVGVEALHVDAEIVLNIPWVLIEDFVGVAPTLRHCSHSRVRRSDLIKVVCPTLERRSHLPFVARAVIDPGDACLMSRDMIEYSLNDVRLDPQLCHPSRSGAT